MNMTAEQWAAFVEGEITLEEIKGGKPLDPSGISDMIHDARKRGEPVTMRDYLLSQQEDNRIN